MIWIVTVDFLVSSGMRPWKRFYREGIQKLALRISQTCIEANTFENVIDGRGLPSLLQEAG